MTKPIEELDEIEKMCKNHEQLSEYFDLYSKVTKTGELKQSVPLSYAENEPMIANAGHITKVTGKVVGALMREGEREKFY